MSLMDSVELNAPDRFFVGGEWIKPSTSAEFDIVNPSDEQVWLRVAEAKDADMDRAVSAARDAFDSGPWPRLSPKERADYLSQIAAVLDSRQSEMSRIWSGESGMLHSIATFGVAEFGAAFRYYAELANSFAFVERHTPTGGGSSGFLVNEPVGVVGAIIPWNAPTTLIAYKVAPALLAGCTVILKSSPEAPGEAYLLAEAAESVGLPPGVLNVLTADRTVSERLVRDPRVDKITFTGSTAAGRRIGSLCGERIARVTLELGGKSAALVLDDYDIATAADNIATFGCLLTGQVCSSLSRVVVSRSRHDALVDALSDRFNAMQVGDAFDPKSQVGPLAMSRQRDRVENYIAKGVSDGARLAAGGKRPPELSRGYFIQPTVFGNVDNSSTIAQEEIFGPVLSVIPADDEQHGIEIVNDTIYGLNNSVFSNDLDRAFHVARQLRSGTVGHNSWRSDFGIAFGGFKQSGVGREGGVAGLRPFLEPKTIILDGAYEPA